MAENQFLTSVADVLLFDDVTGDLILSGETALNTSMTQAIQSQAIYAGKGSKKVFEFSYQKELSFAIEDAVFNVAYIAIQNNTKVFREVADYFTKEFITLDASGEGEVSQTPIGTVQVEQENGAFIQANPNGKKIIDAGQAGKEVRVVYAYKEMMDNITISADSFPKAVRMVLNADISTNNGKEEEMQIIVPKFKPDGALELAMTHDGVSSSALAGTSLADNKGNYAYIGFKKINEDDVPFISLATNPSEIEFDIIAPADTAQLTVYGIRGGTYGNILLDNKDLTFASDDVAVATVDGNGLITVAVNASVGAKTVIRVSGQDYTDVVTVDVI